MDRLGAGGLTEEGLCSDASTADEFVLRRVHKEYFTPTDPIQILRGGFRPTGEDHNGLSVFFDDGDSETPARVAAAGGKDPANYCVIRLRVGDVHRLGLTVSRDDEPPGHGVIPEINIASYSDPVRKKQLKPIQLELARLANEAIVFTPPQRG